MSTIRNALNVALSFVTELKNDSMTDADIAQVQTILRKALSEICGNCHHYLPTRYKYPQCDFWGETLDWWPVEPEGFCDNWEPKVGL